MIAPAVIAAAVAFWAPYGPPVCPQGVQVTRYAMMDPANYVDGLPAIAYSDRGARTCHVWLSDQVGQQPRSVQADIIAHELGHDQFDLSDNNDVTSIMDDFAMDHPPAFFASLDHRRRWGFRPR